MLKRLDHKIGSLWSRLGERLVLGIADSEPRPQEAIPAMEAAR